ncbi:WYL domain-containing protein [Galbitalea sp. SE-J8]|uniref:helix-turn-helix transcriptional regulator n=1 Tax=Galbitalea sp. SE-J8 TaxID=3054952 RepID=UPI00259CC338|nr:WYL domain-containing protein [Galbitalea sp. SE-J8]MDM4764015.1 WYL domain-containing protein [Galbitalea sp. SE-J8]
MASDDRPAQRVPVEERLFSLVLALLATETGLTKSEILSTVQGYRQSFRAGGDNANLERKFERDKDDIRELGVPLETVADPGDPGNNQALRYRIPRGAYELPDDVTFTPEEITLLDLAARVWREGSLSSESRRALLKLRALGVATDEPVIGYAPRVRVRDAAFEPLSTALERRQWVRFDYLKPGESAARERHVAPLALVQFEGRWHLSAEEAGTGAIKTYLLRRIVSRVTTTGKTTTTPLTGQQEAALAGLEEIWRNGVARVRVEPGTDAATRLARRRGAAAQPDGTLELHFVDAAILADELAGFGPEVVVLEPSELATAVRERLERTVADHADA